MSTSLPKKGANRKTCCQTWLIVLCVISFLDHTSRCRELGYHEVFSIVIYVLLSNCGSSGWNWSFGLSVIQPWSKSVNSANQGLGASSTLCEWVRVPLVASTSSYNHKGVLTSGHYIEYACGTDNTQCSGCVIATNTHQTRTEAEYFI